MKYKPIIFSTEMINAIIKGRKTQTRRIIKDINKYQNMNYLNFIDPDIYSFENKKQYFTKNIKCPYQIGQKLWVRETWCYCEDTIRYKTDKDDCKCDIHKWKSPIYMPKKIVRIWLEIINIKVERIQDISKEDCLKEGIIIPYHIFIRSENLYKYNFMKLWNSINAKRGYSWKSNPYVWVIEFKRSKK